jgi:undecaprenyl-diphosphatase
VMTTELGCLSMNWLVKRFSARERPALWERVGWFGWGSYPSGHAMVSLAMLFTVAIILDRERGWRWPYWAAGTLVVLIVYSRLFHGVHWPTDMIGGLLVGGLWLAATKRAFAGSRAPAG